MTGAAGELLRHSTTPLSHPAMFRPARREIGKSQGMVLLHLANHRSYLWDGDSIEDPNDMTQLTEWNVSAKYIVSQSIVSVAGTPGISIFYRAFKVSLVSTRYCTANITWTLARVLRYICIRIFLPFRAVKDCIILSPCPALKTAYIRTNPSLPFLLVLLCTRTQSVTLSLDVSLHTDHRWDWT